MADTYTIESMSVDIPVEDSSSVLEKRVEVVKIEKVEPCCVEIEVTTCNDDLIVPDSRAIDMDCSGISDAVPETVVEIRENVQVSKIEDTVMLVTNNPDTFNPKIASTPTVAAVASEPISTQAVVKTVTPYVTPKSDANSVLTPLRTPRNKVLVSSILSAEDIAKEIIARGEKKATRTLPLGGDLIFQKQLTKRLAEKVVKEETLNQSLSVEMFTPPPPPALPKMDVDTPDLDAQMLLQILEEGAESQYPEPKGKVVPLKLPKYTKSEKDRELERTLALKQLMEVSRKKRGPRENNNNTSVSPKSDQKPKKRLKNEVQKLLQDEGAINMLYAMEKGEDAKVTALPSKRRMKKALMKKAQEVSQAILEGSSMNKGLRLRHPTKDSNDSTEIKKDPDGPENHSSTENKVDFVTPSPSTPAASKIIRRHSSSSSYSGNNSPVRRISLDEAIKSDSEKDRRVIENGVAHSPISKQTKSHIKTTNKLRTIKAQGKMKGKLTPKLVQKTLTDSMIKKNVNGNQKVKQVKTVKLKNTALKETSKLQPPVNSNSKNIHAQETNVAGTSKVINTSHTSENVVSKVPQNDVNKSIDLPIDQNGFKEKLQMDFTNKLKSMIVRQKLISKNDQHRKHMSSTPNSSKVQPQSIVNKPLSSPDKQLLTENKSLTCEAIWQMLQDDWNMGDDPDDPPSPFEGQSLNESPSTSVIEMDLKPLPLPPKNEIAPLPASEPELDVIPENKSEVPFSHQYGSSSYMYKELMLRRIGPLTHVNIAPISTHLPQAFNVQVLKELCSVLEICSSDSRCRCLLLTSSGSLFSSGVDLPCLLATDPQTRSSTAKTMAQAIKDFAHKLGMFSKMVVAGVSGPCVGLGVAMLPLCDVVISSPRSVYLTPYASLGYIPEAGATLTLPAVVGHRMASSMLISGRKLNAQEAVNCGLVTQLLPEENFANQVLETAFNISTQSVLSMESTKALMMHSVRSRLNNALVTEAALLQQHWLTHDCQTRIKEKADKLLNE